MIRNGLVQIMNETPRFLFVCFFVRLRLPTNKVNPVDNHALTRTGNRIRARNGKAIAALQERGREVRGRDRGNLIGLSHSECERLTASRIGNVKVPARHSGKCNLQRVGRHNTVR